jgi:hypothetical protein
MADTFFTYSEEQKNEIRSFLDSIADEREKFIRRNRYYYSLLKGLVSDHIPPGSRVCHVGCDTGGFLESLEPAEGVGICLSGRFAEICSERHPEFTFYYTGWEEQLSGSEFDYILLTNPGYLFDIQEVLDRLEALCHNRTKLIVVNNNYLWEPVFSIGEKLGLRVPQPVRKQNFVPTHVIEDMLVLAGMETVRWDAHILIPFFIPLVSWFCNKLFSSVFPFRLFSLVHILIARTRKTPPRPVKVSVVVPCKDEKGHIEPIIKRMVKTGDETELLFVDDRSTDGTGDEVRRCMELYPDIDIRCVEGPGISKGEAVRVGFEAASGDILAILDADIAVAPEELPKSVDPLIEGHADFVNTVRFVYPQQGGAMRWLNIMGNKVFAFIFSVILQQRIGDTLSGTKVFWKEDYKNIARYKNFWIWRDRWGDFEQLLGASKLGLKIMDVPVHYMERTYGVTKMKNRLENGILMLKVSFAGLFKLRLR